LSARQANLKHLNSTIPVVERITFAFILFFVVAVPAVPAAVGSRPGAGAGAVGPSLVVGLDQKLFGLLGVPRRLSRCHGRRVHSFSTNSSDG
jgi:hypothetical protein